MAHNLYRKILIDHYRHPRHAKLLPSPTHQADTANRSCGDRVRVSLKVENNTITEVGITVEGCALAVAGGSVLAEHLINKSVTDVKELNEAAVFNLLGDIRPTPSRARCATLAQEALRTALGAKHVATSKQLISDYS